MSTYPMRIIVTFKIFDKDNNGYIDRDELLSMYTTTYHSLLGSLRVALSSEVRAR